MELKDLKKILALAKKAGVKSLSIGDVSFELFDNKIQTRRNRKQIDERPAPPQEPTLDEINNYIYSNEDFE